MTIILIPYSNKLFNHVNYRMNNLDETKDAHSLKTAFLVLNLLLQCLLWEELNTLFRMTAGVFMGRWTWVKKKGFAKEQLKNGLASVQRMKFLRINIMNLTWHRNIGLIQFPLQPLGHFDLNGSWIWPGRCTKKRWL